MDSGIFNIKHENSKFIKESPAVTTVFIDENGDNKKRGPTFTTQETELLIDLITKYKSVIFSKSASSKVLRKKQIAWKKISNKFNSYEYTHNRSVGCLKHKWDNMKNSVRKSMEKGQIITEDHLKQIVDWINDPNNSNIRECDFPSGTDEDEFSDSSFNLNEDGSEKTKQRGRNFSTQETSTLLDLLERYHSIIMRKGVSGELAELKDFAWKEILKKFNSKTNDGIEEQRTLESLKHKWDNMKWKLEKKKVHPDGVFEDEFSERVWKLVNKPLGEVQMPDSDDDHFDKKPSNDALPATAAKKRSENFTSKECALLLQCLRPEAKHIFSKNKTGLGIKMTQRAWERVTQAYNSRSTRKRTAKVLKHKFDNMKYLTRILLKENKQNEKVADNSEMPIVCFQNGKVADDSEMPIDIKVEPDMSYEMDMADDISNEPNADESSEDDPNDNITLDKHINDQRNDPLRIVLNGDSAKESSLKHGSSSFDEDENKVLMKLKFDIVNMELETAQLNRQRIEEAIKEERDERDFRALERSMRLRALRLEVLAAESKFSPDHPALVYRPNELPMKQYLNSL